MLNFIFTIPFFICLLLFASEKTFDNAKDVVQKTHDAFAKAMADDE